MRRSHLLFAERAQVHALFAGLITDKLWAVRSYGEIEKIIVDDLERATARFREESARFRGVMQDVPSGIPHPDGSLRVQQTSAAYKKALADLECAVERHHAFFVRRIVPDDLQD